MTDFPPDPDDLDDPLVITIDSLEDLDGDRLMEAIRKARNGRPGHAEVADRAGIEGIAMPATLFYVRERDH